MKETISQNKDKILFDGILLDPKYRPLINDLKKRGISTQAQIRKTALSAYVQDKFQRQNDFLQDLKICIADTTSPFSTPGKWDDEIGKEIPIQSFTSNKSILSKCDFLNIKTLFDLFSKSEKELQNKFENAHEFCEDISDAKRMPVAALNISAKIINILNHNGIRTVGQLIMTGAAYLIQLPGMNLDTITLLKDVIYHLPNLLTDYRRIIGKPETIKIQKSAQSGVDKDVDEKEIHIIPTSEETNPVAPTYPMVTEDGFHKFLLLQGKGNFINNYVQQIHDLESPQANLGIGQVKLLGLSSDKSMENLILIRNSLPGTKWNTEKYKTTLAYFETFLRSFTKDNLPTNTPLKKSFREYLVSRGLEYQADNYIKSLLHLEMKAQEMNLAHKKLFNDDLDSAYATFSLLQFKMEGSDWNSNSKEALKWFGKFLEEQKKLLDKPEKNEGYISPDNFVEKTQPIQSVPTGTGVGPDNNPDQLSVTLSETSDDKVLIEATVESDNDESIEEQVSAIISAESIEEIRIALEKIYGKNKEIVYPNKVWYYINRSQPLSQVCNILEDAEWAHKNEDGSFSYFSVSKEMPLDTEKPETELPDSGSQQPIPDTLSPCIASADTEIKLAPTIWADYEAAVLLEACLNMKNEHSNRNTVISEVSFKLRLIAKYKGYTIDSSFRNENGINNQIQRMESAIAGKTISQPSTRQFRYIVEIYKTDRSKYNSLLREVDELIKSGIEPTGEETNTLDPNIPGAQPRWNEYEAAVLLDAYLKVRENPEKRKYFVQQVSNQLRQMAINQGMEISDIFRNFAGIDRQMDGMRSAWTGEDPVGHATASKMFLQMVSLYKTNRAEFDSLLIKANDIIQTKAEPIGTIEQDLSEYLENQTYSEDKIAEIIRTLKTIEKIGIDHNLGRVELLGDDPQISLESMRIIQNSLSQPEINTKENRNVLRIFARYLEDTFGYKVIQSDESVLNYDKPQSEKQITRDGFKEYLKQQGVVDKKIAFWLACLGIMASKCGIDKIYDISQSEAKAITKKIEDKLRLTELQTEEKKEALSFYKKYADIQIADETQIEISPLEGQFREFLQARHYSENEIAVIVDRIYHIESQAQKKHWIVNKLFGDSYKLSLLLVETIQRFIPKSNLDTFPNRKALNAFSVFLKQEKDKTEDPGTTSPPPVTTPPDSMPHLPLLDSMLPPIAPKEPLAKRVENILLEKESEGMTLSELQKAIQVKQYEIQDVIQKSPNIIELKSRFYHKDTFIDIDEAADQLEKILDKLMAQNDNVSTAGLLYKHAHSEMNMFLNDNDLDDQKSVFDLGKHFFMKCHYHDKNYNFYDYTYITCSGIKIEKLQDLIKRFARSKNGTFTQDELKNYLEKLELPTDNLHGKMKINIAPDFFIYAPKEYLLAESMNINIEFFNKSHKALANLLEDSGDYVIPRNIHDIWYYQLPALPHNLSWTPILLQQILHFYSDKIGFRTIPAMEYQSYDTLQAALVPNDSWIKDFRDIAALYLHEFFPEQTIFEAEELRLEFKKSGMIEGNQLIWNMHKALSKDPRFIWDSDNQNVRIKLQ